MEAVQIVRWFRLAFLFGVILLGCGRKSPVDKVVFVADDDAKMNAAIEKAKATVPTFIAAVNNPKPSQSRFSVKMRFGDEKNGEHMWLDPVRFDGRKFQGLVANQPVKISSIKMGQMMSVEPFQISDWMFVENGKLVGGYTIRVLRDALPANEKAEMDKSLPFVVD